MAASGAVNLRPAPWKAGAQAWFARRRACVARSEGVGEELLFPRGAVPQSRAEGGEGRLLPHRERKDARRGGRVGLRQDHGRAPGGAAAPGHRRRSTVRGPQPARGGRRRLYALQAAHPDRVPESLRLAQSAFHRGADPHRADADPCHRRGPCRAPRHGGRAAQEGGLERRLGGQVPARVLRRPAPAHRHRPRADAAARAADLRRVGLGARRLGAGAVIEPPAGSAGRIRHELSLHLARPRCGALHGRRGDGDEGRRDRRDCRSRRALRQPQAPLHPAPAVVDPRARAVRFVLLLAAMFAAPAAWGAHAYAQFGDIKYPMGFAHFEWVNPNAPKGGNLDLVPPLLVGSLAGFSRDWGAGKPFDQVIMDMPIGSGPYRIKSMDRDVTYERDPKYWARELGVRRGMYNFDRVTYKIYKDNTAQTEAFKAGEFDYLRTFSAREWARVYVGKKFDSGELIRAELPTKNAGDFQGYWINTRREKFKDVRVRQALTLAFDFEWMNRRLMYNSYIRCTSWFNGSDFEATGLPGDDELKVLQPLRKQLSARVFNEEVPLPPSTNPPANLRDNLRKARELLAAAGWTYRDGALRNAKGEAFTLEYLDSAGGERVITPWFQALAKLGIQGEYRRADFALIQKRLDVFDFDLFTIRVPGNEAPGADLVARFASDQADVEGSSNLIGIKDPAVDAILNLVVEAGTRPELIARLRALDRVLRHGPYVVPHWDSNTFRVAYRGGKFEQPEVKPLYYVPDDWVVSTWWRKR